MFVKNNKLVDNKRTTIYKINKTSLKYYMDLNFLSNCFRVEFHKNLVQQQICKYYYGR